MTSITNAVLSERQAQQFTQTMVLLAQIDDKLTVMNGTVRGVQINGAEQKMRIKVNEKRLLLVEGELRKAQKQAWKVAIAVALLAGAGMAGADRVLSLVIP